jgi:hypothetical protein
VLVHQPFQIQIAAYHLLWGKSPGDHFGSGKTFARSLARNLSLGQRQFMRSSNGPFLLTS